MNNFEFVNFKPTPSEKYKGIATVKAYGKILLRYKIVPTKDGKGYFPATASCKAGNENGEDVYVSSFLIDSRSDEEELKETIRSSMRSILQQNSMPEVGECPF